jgi:peptidoglycan/xylan/chitin deacetylase (PgdA/CDA1 family)
MLSRVVKLCIASTFAVLNSAYTTLCRLSGWAVAPTFVVLMYHSVKTGERERFTRQMDRLLKFARPVRADFTPDATGRTRNYVAITFDDGYRSILDNALPILHERSIPVTIFVPTGHVGGSARWVRDDNPRDKGETLLRAEELKHLYANGVTIGSHSVSHRPLPSLQESEALAELVESRRALEALLGDRVPLCALPYGASSAGVLRLAQDAGYTRVFLGDPIRSRGQIDGHVTGRIGVSPTDWSLEYLLKIRGAYRWLPWAIAAKRRILDVVQRQNAAAPTPLDPGYSVQVDTVTREQWYEIISRFDDCNIYQTWSYESARPGRNELSHLILRRDDTIVAVAQARIVRLPFLGWGAAYVRWGPLWKRRGEAHDLEVLRQALRAMRNEYALRRGLVLRTYPRLFHHDADRHLPVLEGERYRLRDRLPTETTLLVDLTPELEQLRRGLHQKWRADLNHAERNDLEIVEGEDVWQLFTELHAEMVQRKKFVETADLEHFRAVQKDLPEEFKLKVMIAKANAEAGAGLVCSALGNTGIYLFGATNRTGMSSKGSYLLQWQAIVWMKKLGLEVYDLHGINPQANPGTYQFKARLCGRNGKEAQFLGQIEVYRSTLSLWTVRGGELARASLRRLWNRSSRS